MGKKRKQKERRHFEFVSDVMRRQGGDVLRETEGTLILGSVALVLAIKQDASVTNGEVGGHLTKCGADLTLHSMLGQVDSGAQTSYQVLTMMRDQMELVYKVLDEARERVKHEMAQHGQQIIHYTGMGPDGDIDAALRESVGSTGMAADGKSMVRKDDAS